MRCTGPPSRAHRERIGRQFEEGPGGHAQFGEQVPNPCGGALKLGRQEVRQKRLEPSGANIVDEGARPAREFGIEVAADHGGVDVNTWQAHSLTYGELRAYA